MKHLLTVLFLFLLTGSFVSCGNKKKDPEPTDPKTQLLINKEWRATGDVVIATPVAGGASTTTDRYKDYPACQKDDFIRFNDDFTLHINEGPGKCAPPDPQTATGTWSWNADKTVLTMTDPSLDPNLPSNLSGPVDLTSNTFTVKQTYTQNGMNNVRTLTYGSI